MLARIIQRNQRRDLAHPVLRQLMPQTAAVIPLASCDAQASARTCSRSVIPKTYLWSFGQGVVSQIRPDYEWKYPDGIPRSAIDDP